MSVESVARDVHESRSVCANVVSALKQKHDKGTADNESHISSCL